MCTFNMLKLVGFVFDEKNEETQTFIKSTVKASYFDSIGA